MIVVVIVRSIWMGSFSVGNRMIKIWKSLSVRMGDYFIFRMINGVWLMRRRLLMMRCMGRV